MYGAPPTPNAGNEMVWFLGVATFALENPRVLGHSSSHPGASLEPEAFVSAGQCL